MPIIIPNDELRVGMLVHLYNVGNSIEYKVDKVYGNHKMVSISCNTDSFTFVSIDIYPLYYTKKELVKKRLLL